MANYQAAARSNYFRFIPQRLAALEKIFGPHDIQVVHEAPDLVAIIGLTENGSPSAMIDCEELTDSLFELGIENADNIDEVDLIDVIYTLLPPGETLVWIEVGHEKARYLIGQATRFNHEGMPIQHIDLNEIYREGERRAEY